MRILLLAIVFSLASAVPAAGDPPRSVSSYYLARADQRECPSPRCGGLWVHLVNRSGTTCGDGSVRRECYVAVVHLSSLRLGDRKAVQLGALITAGRALVRGRLEREGIEGFELDGLVVSEVWTASGSPSAPAGVFRKVTDNGIRCVTSPCFSIHTAALNTGRSVDVSVVDLSSTGASVAEQRAALARIANGGLIAAGRVVRVPHAGPAGTGRTLVASQYYVRATR